MNNLKEVILERLINCGKKSKRLKTPVIMLITLFLILFHSIRNFFMQLKMHPFIRRALASTLCVCLVISSMPTAAYAFPVLAAENSEKIQENTHDGTHEIVSFMELPDEVKEQTVTVGTPLESLELPDTLTALCHISNEKNLEDNADSDNELDSEEKDKADEEKEEIPEEDLNDGAEDESGDSDKENEDSDNEGEGSEDESEDSGNENEENEETSEVNTGASDEDAEGRTDEGNAGNNETVETQETYTVTLRENYAMPNEFPEIKELYYEEESAVSETDSEENGSDSGEVPDIEKTIEETVTLNGITWESLPEYDSEIEGVYIFTPVFSDGTYTLAEDVRLPEISVTVADLGIMLAEEDQTDVSGSTTPMCGVISSDTIWEEAGTLKDGELIINPGVTLTINGEVIVRGNVNIKGGGTILRGNEDARINIYTHSNVAVSNITIEGNDITSRSAMIHSSSNNLVLGEGCVIKNCIHKAGNGGAIFVSDGTLVLDNATIQNCHVIGGSHGGGAVYMYSSDREQHINLIIENAIIENCSASAAGGAIDAALSDVIIKNGIFKNNKSSVHGGCIDVCGRINTTPGGTLTIYDGDFIGNTSGTGGCIGIQSGTVALSTLTIYGGNFIDNIAEIRGGCIGDYSYEHNYGDVNSVIDIQGGYFEGNRCTNKEYKGSGATYNDESSSDLILSSDAHFCGDGAYGTDGIMLDDGRKVWISNTLNYPATVYVAASDDCVIAEGYDGYILSLEKDIEKINFVDIGDSGETYYTVLDEANNQIKLSTIEPDYGYSVIYMSNGAQEQVEDDTKYGKDDTITVKSADGLSREGYRFTGWNTKADGSGDSYQPGDTIEGIEEDITLYAQWELDGAEYTVEHYLQDRSGDGYTKAESDTETLSGTVGEEVNAMPKTYRGFTENTVHESRKESGVVASDGSLVLKLYYDRDIYNIAFDLNGGTGTAPEAQEVRYGALLQEVGTPERRGYTFLGWYKDKLGTEGKAWDFGKTIEENTENKTETLYAKWVDDIAPRLMQAEFNEGYKSFNGGLVRKKDLIITVPIIEEGSGVKQADYVLSSLERSDSENESGQAQIIEENGRTVARITISYDFRGTVSMTCTDNAGNISAGKTLTAPGGGAAFIVEDNAPEITFSSKSGSLSDSFYGNVTVTVSVNDEETPDSYADTSKKAKITGGIASVTYSIDNGAEITVEGKGFENGIVPSCDFSVEVSGVGEHILRVIAKDNAGNENTGQVRIRIAQESMSQESTSQGNKIPAANNNLPAFASKQFIDLADESQPLETVNPAGVDELQRLQIIDTTRNNEPRTGDTSYVEVYATIAMITGLLYVLLYFTTDRNGMTQEEKEQFLSCLTRWAKRGGKLRRLLATAAIFVFLVYYHSIGKCMAHDEKEVRV